jgi:hypothetical protein
MRPQETRRRPFFSASGVFLPCDAQECGKQDLNLHPLTRTRPSSYVTRFRLHCLCVGKVLQVPPKVPVTEIQRSTDILTKWALSCQPCPQFVPSFLPKRIRRAP